MWTLPLQHAFVAQLIQCRTMGQKGLSTTPTDEFTLPACFIYTMIRASCRQWSAYAINFPPMHHITNKQSIQTLGASISRFAFSTPWSNRLCQYRPTENTSLPTLHNYPVSKLVLTISKWYTFWCDVTDVFFHSLNWLDCKLSFQTHIKHLQSKVKSRICFLFRNKASFTHAAKHTLVKLTIIPILDFGNVIYKIASNTLLNKLDAVYHSATRFGHQSPIYYPPLRPVRSRWLALASYSSPNPLAPCHLQDPAR